MKKQLFLDCDGVLANFDDSAERILGEHPRGYEARHSEEIFWHKLSSHEAGFYRTLDVLPQGRLLFEAVKHLEPVILTGCPQGGWAEKQKEEWAAEHFPGIEIITCRSAEKYKHMRNKGDILVDDLKRYRHVWEHHGGAFVLYENNAAQAIVDLAALGLPMHPEPQAGSLFNRSTAIPPAPPAIQLSLIRENCVN